MERIAVVGPGGAGKSTFASALGAWLDLPVVHLDRHYWRPGWVEPSKQEWVDLQSALVAADRWVMDGNYGGTLDIRFARADTVIVLEPSRLTRVAGALQRTLANRGRAVQAPGCPERLDLGFLRWIWRYRRDSRPRLDGALARHPHLRVVELRSRRRAAAFLDRQASQPG